MPMPPPRSSPLTARPSARNSSTSSATRSKAGGDRPDISARGADMHRQTDRLDTRQFVGQAKGFAGLLDIDAEFVFPLAGGDLGVGHRVDVRVDPDADADGPATRCGDLAEPAQFGD